MIQLVRQFGRWLSGDNDRRLVENLRGMFSDPSNIYVDPDENPQVDKPTGGSSPANRKKMIDHARMIYKTPTGRNIVEQKVNHVAGDEFSISLGKDFDLQKEWPSHRRFFQQFVRRTERDGECFVFWDGKSLTFVDPECVKTPMQYTSDERVIEGVMFYDPDDVTSIAGYFIEDEWYSSAQVFHYKSFLTDDTDVRGKVPLYEASYYILRYEQFLNFRYRLNAFRSMIVLFRKFKNATSTDIQNTISSLRDGTLTRPESGRQTDLMKMRPGMQVNHSDNVEYEYKSPDTGAGEAEVDGRSLRLHIASFFQMPEYMLWSDASNANYASTSVAQNPWVKAMVTAQGNYNDSFEFLAGKKFPGRKAEISSPPLIAENGPALTGANRLMWEAGVMSKRTWQVREGLDPDEEAKNVELEGGSGALMS